MNLGVERLKRLLRDSGASEAFARVWTGFARPALALERDALEEQDATPLGATKLGGLPDFADGAGWPVRPAYAYTRNHQHRPESWRRPHPLAFIGQVNLADVANVGGCGLPLPEAGLLQVFYDTENQPWGYDPADLPGTVVRFVPLGATLHRPAPPQAEWPLTDRVAQASLRPVTTLPDYAWLAQHLVEERGWHEDAFFSETDFIDEDVYSDLYCQTHAIGGWPALLQNPPEEQCEFVSAGIYCGDESGHQSQQALALKPNAQFWKQLFQFCGGEELDWTGGDTSARIYVMARKQDIAARAFRHSLTIFQCT